MLLNQEQVTKTLKQTLPKLTELELSLATAALMAASKEWQEVNLKENLGANVSIQCKDICALGEAHDRGVEIRAFIKPK